MLTYIRHIYGGKREASDKTDVFTPINQPHQDVLRYSCISQDDLLIYTWGKQVFPKNNEISNTHQRWTIVCVVEGVLLCGKEQLNTGDFAVIPRECPHTLASKNEDVLFYWCTTNDEILINILSLCGYQDSDITRGHLEKMTPIADIFEKTLYRFPDEGDQRVYLMSAYTALFSYLSTVNNEQQMQKMSEQLFKRCLSHIEYTNGNITVDYLAKRYFISRRYLYAMFKENKNISPIDYILNVRMTVADRYLITTDMSVSKIAELTGYSDYNHFSRAYKKYYGMLPSKRRKDTKARTTDTQEAEIQKKKPSDD